MSWLDVAILIILAISLFVGLKLGLIRTILTLAGVVVGIILAGRYYLSLAEKITFAPSESAARVIAFVAILVGVIIVATLIAIVLKWITSAIMLGWLNHLGGAVLGVFLGALFCGAILAVWMKFVGPNDVITKSFLAGLILKELPIILALLPQEFGSIKSFFQ